jgi:hypothetical protein
MITIKNLSDPEFFHDQKNSRIELLDKDLYPLTLWIADRLQRKEYKFLKEFASETTSHDISVVQHNLLNMNLSDESRASSEAFVVNSMFPDSTSLPYVFLYSKTHLRQKYFADYLPSAFHAFITTLHANNCIKIIGPGHGSVVLFNFDNLSKDFQLVAPTSTVELQSSISSFIDSYNQLTSDNSYLIDVIYEKDQQIKALSEKVIKLEYDNYLTSTQTWR